MVSALDSDNQTGGTAVQFKGERRNHRASKNRIHFRLVFAIAYVK